MAPELDRRAALAAMAAMGLGALAPSGARAQGRFQGKQLVSQGFGGVTQDVLQKIVFDTFDQQMGCRSTQVPLQSAAAFARMRAEAAAPQIDMYQFSGGQQILAASEGLSADVGNLANMADVPATMKDPGGKWVTFAVIAEGILYRTDKVKTPPKSYKDFLDPAYDGHIAFPTITNGYGTDFLVMLARAYGGGEKDIEPGFKAMARFAANATIFKAATEVPGLFAQSDVWIMPYDFDFGEALQGCRLAGGLRGARGRERCLALRGLHCREIVNLELARAAVDHFISVPCQTGIAEQLQWAPTNDKVQLSEALAKQLPRPDQLISLDGTVMTQQRPQWTERWNKEIGHS